MLLKHQSSKISTNLRSSWTLYEDNYFTMTWIVSDGHAVHALWALWKAQNAGVFKEDWMTTEAVLILANKLYTDYNSNRPLSPAFGSFSSVSNTQQQVSIQSSQNITWQLPPQDWCKVNVDGAIRQGISAAGVWLEIRGVGLFAAGRRCTEARDSRGGFIQQMDLHNVILEGDAQTVVNLINSPSCLCLEDSTSS